MQRVGANIVWVESQALEAELGAVEAKEGDVVSAGYAFEKCACSDGGVGVQIVLTEVGEALGHG